MKSLKTDLTGGYDLRIDELETIQSNVKQITSALGRTFLDSGEKAVILWGCGLSIGMGQVTVQEGAIMYKPTSGEAEVYLVDAGSYSAGSIVDTTLIPWDIVSVDSVPVVFYDTTTNNIVNVKKMYPNISPTVITDTLVNLKYARLTAIGTKSSLNVTNNWSIAGGSIRYWKDALGDIKISLDKLQYIGASANSAVLINSALPSDMRPVNTQTYIIPGDVAGNWGGGYLYLTIDTAGLLTITALGGYAIPANVVFATTTITVTRQAI